MTTLKSECRKFAPNIFNKNKCQNCFRTKDAHSAKALESNRATRKVSTCGYLFVAPDWDFSVTINRTKRWQRRWFVLYDDGELTYSVDEYPDTVPQAVIDMNKVIEVSDAEDVTGNQFAIAIAAPEKVHFIKGTSKEESKWWFDVLCRFPRVTIRSKHKRNATYPGGKVTTIASENAQVEGGNNKDGFTTPVSQTRFQNSNTEPLLKNLKEWHSDHTDEDAYPTKENGSYLIENVEAPSPADRISIIEVEQGENCLNNVVNMENVNNALNKIITSTSNSISNNKNMTASQTKLENAKNNADKNIEDVICRDKSLNELIELKKGRTRRYLKRESRGLKSQRSRSDGVAKMIPPFTGRERYPLGQWSQLDVNITPSAKTYHHNPVYLLLSDSPSIKRHESLETLKTDASSSSPLLPRRRHTSEKGGVVRCISFNETRREFPQSYNYLRKSGSLVNISLEASEFKNANNSQNSSLSINNNNNSERDTKIENKLAVSCVPTQPTKINSETEQQVEADLNENIRESINSNLFQTDLKTDFNQEELFVKKGWLMMQRSCMEWSKQWFVLRSTSLNYYRDPTAEDAALIEGTLDLRQLTDVKEVESEKNYVFSLIMWDETLLLSAVTAGIRNNWIQAIKHSANFGDVEPKKEIPPDDKLCEDQQENNYLSGDTKQYFLQSSPISSRVEPEKLIDLSSSDDQSEYFSIVDEEETADRSSSPRAFPPSPPLNRSSMSSIKECTMLHSKSYSEMPRLCAACGESPECLHAEHHSDGTASDNSVGYAVDSPVWSRKKYNEYFKRPLNLHWHMNSNTSSKECIGRNTFNVDLNHSENTLQNKLTFSDHNDISMKFLEDRCKELEERFMLKEKEVKDKNSELDSLKCLKSTYVELMDKYNNLRKKMHDHIKHGIQNTEDESYRLKYELLKNKYMRERAEWETKLRKEKLNNSANSSRDSKYAEEFLKNIQKSKEYLNELIDRLRNSQDKSADSSSLVKVITRLCEEAEKLPPMFDRKSKKDSDMKKLKKTILELQSLCGVKQRKLDEEQNKIKSLYCILEKKENELQHLQLELEVAKDINTNATYRLKQLEAALISSDVAESFTINHDPAALLSQNKQLKLRFEMIKDEIKRVKKDLKDSYASYDDLEIHCIKLKQDMKNVQEVHQSQIGLMTARVDDLTSKLTLSERNLRQLKQKVVRVEAKQERRRSSLKCKETLSLSKEYETKLAELEQKIGTIEGTLKDDSKDSEATDISECNNEENASSKHLQKQLSSDNPGSENMGLLLRLHTLGLRVKAAAEAVEKHSSNQKDEEELEKPKICLQIRNDEEFSIQEEGEDWSTLSFTTSMTDLQTIDTDDNEYPSSIGDCLEFLGQKVDGLLTWLRTSLMQLQRQEIGSSSDATLKTLSGDDKSYFSSAFDVLLGYLSESRLEETLNSSNDSKCAVVCLLYKLLLIHESSKFLNRSNSIEGSKAFDLMSVVATALDFLSNHLTSINYNSTEYTNLESKHIDNNLHKLYSLCNDIVSQDPISSFTNFSPTTSSNCTSSDKIKYIQELCIDLLKLLESVKESKFSRILLLISEAPVQEFNYGESQNHSLYSEDFRELLLTGMCDVISKVFQIAETRIFKNHSSTILGYEKDFINLWNSTVSGLMKEELATLIQDLKSQISYILDSCINDINIEKAAVFSCLLELAHCLITKAIVQSIVNILRDSNADKIKDGACFVNKNSPLIAEFHEQLCHCAEILSKTNISCLVSNQDQLPKMLEQIAVDNAVSASSARLKNSKNLEENKVYKRLLHNLQRDFDVLNQNREKYKMEECELCKELKCKNIQLQSRINSLIEKQKVCKQCIVLHEQLQEAVNNCQKELNSLKDYHLKEVDSIRNECQNAIQCRELIHKEELKKLENELNKTHKQLKHLEVEYDEQIQSLKELYEQRLSQKQDPINEEAIRSRYQAEIDQLKCLCEKGLVAMENVHCRVISDLEFRHKHELKQLEAEKEKVLSEETQATLTALEVLRKAHKEELQLQIARFKDEFMKKVQRDQAETLHRYHENELSEIKKQILSLTEKYTIKCLESASYEERMESLSLKLQEAKYQVFDLLARNKQLRVHLAIDKSQNVEALNGKETAESVEELKQILKLRESELAEEREENAQIRQDLRQANARVNMLDVQCQQMDQSLKGERRLREEEVNKLRSRLDAIIVNYGVLNDNSLQPQQHYPSIEQNCGVKSPFIQSSSFTFSGGMLELCSVRRALFAPRTRELMRSPSCPGLEEFKISSS